MTKEKTMSPSSLLPSLQTVGSGFALAHVPVITTPGLSRDETHIIAEVEKQKLKIQATAAKAAYGISKAGELQTCSGQVFANTCGKIDRIVEATAATDSAAYIKQFAEHQRDQLANQLVMIYEDGMGMIRREILTPLPNEAPPPPRKSRSWFGGG
jgi:hypothetical protein